jgi:hypothetical protein
VNKLYIATDEENGTVLYDDGGLHRSFTTWSHSGEYMPLDENIFNQTWDDEPIEVALVKVVKPKESKEPFSDIEESYTHDCECGCMIMISHKHCSECGAKLDWSEK